MENSLDMTRSTRYKAGWRIEHLSFSIPLKGVDVFETFGAYKCVTFLNMNFPHLSVSVLKHLTLTADNKPLFLRLSLTSALQSDDSKAGP